MRNSRTAQCSIRRLRRPSQPLGGATSRTSRSLLTGADISPFVPMTMGIAESSCCQENDAAVINWWVYRLMQPRANHLQLPPLQLQADAVAEFAALHTSCQGTCSKTAEKLRLSASSAAALVDGCEKAVATLLSAAPSKSRIEVLSS